MTEPTPPTSVLRRRPAAGAAAGLLTALAVGASVLLLPTDGSPADAEAVTSVQAQPVAARAALMHPVQPDQATAPAAAQPARPARDPFRPLLSADGQGTSAPAGSPSVSTPDSGAPVATSPDVVVVEPPRAGPQIPETSVPDGSSGSVTDAKLELAKVEVNGESFVGVLSLDGQKMRAKVGDSFGPGGQLLLLSLQQGPRDSQWTAVVQAGRGEPFDVVSGTPTRIPSP